jgi:hypothetical protein
MGEKVDVALHVLLKPYQTMVALKTLMQHSGRHIDKIYLIQEKNQPPDTFDSVLKAFGNIVQFIPDYFLGISSTDRKKYHDQKYRYSLRYQYAIENTDKKYLYITHNDILYTADTIGDMLDILDEDEYAGVGQIGQCWNCPAFIAKQCSGDTYLEYDPSYEAVMTLVEKYPPARGQQFISLIDKEQPMPLPECRLNEFGCLIDLGKIRHEVIPCGTTDPFGTYVGIDLASSWFRDLALKGYKFKNYDLYKSCRHGWGPLSGHQTLMNFNEYQNAESKALEYYEKNLQ